MPNKFYTSAKAETVLSEIMQNREKLDVDEIITRYPDGITLTEFDMVTTYNAKKKEDATYPVFAFKEDENACFFGGMILNRIVNTWIAAYDGDIQTASKELKSSGGVKVKMSHKKTSAGNNLIHVEVVE